MADSCVLEGRKLLRDDHTYSTVDDTQGQMLMVSSNPAYGTVTEHSKQAKPPRDDQTYCTVESGQQEAVIVSANLAYATSLRVAAGAK